MRERSPRARGERTFAGAALRDFLAMLVLLLLPVAPAAADWEVEILEPVEDPARGEVVLLHGLNRGAGSMSDLGIVLARAGYRVLNVDYPSARHSVEALASGLDRTLASCCGPPPATARHFVTHSLGGVLARVWADRQPPGAVGRSVMLSPPSQGSELVDELRDSALFKLVTGPAGQQLGTNADSVPLRLGPVRFELGVITGRNTLNPLYSFLIPGEDDGKVGVDRARAPGTSDFLVVEHSHTFIMNSPEVHAQVLHFLAQGQFRR